MVFFFRNYLKEVRRVWLATGLVVFVVLTFSNCEKEEPNLSVKNYMNVLKNGSYNNLYLPDFTSNDIAALLAYRNDTTTITNFPVNPISSCYCSKPSLGLYALWTIEAIRLAESRGITQSVQKFPSLNPRIISKVGEDLDLVDRTVIQKEIAKQYLDWWNNTSVPLSVKLNTNPLKTSIYQWY